MSEDLTIKEVKMSRINRIMNADQDITEEVLGVISITGITPDILDRFSSLLVIQIYAAFMSRTEDPFRICHEILCLEGKSLRGESHTKPPTMFNRKPYLKGLWHKHYQGVGVPSMAQNLRNSLKKYGIPYIEEKLEESKRTGVTHYLTEEDAKKIAHQVVTEHYTRRSLDKEMTGHWIIYTTIQEKNYYLSLGKHTDDEAELRNMIEKSCSDEFPFLSSVLEKLPE